VIDVDIEAAATALAGAEARRVPIEPLTGRFDGIDVSGAYRIQLRNARRRIAAGDAVRGHKIGLTARAMQELFGVDEPDFGHLFDSMFVADGGTIALDRLIAPQVEVEPAFLLAQELRGPGITAADVIDATEAVVPALEIIDSRIEGWRVKLEDTVADNGSSAAVVLGAEPVAADAERLAGAGVVLADERGVIERGNTRDILGHPAVAVAWLANALAEFGVALEAGHIVLPGTCTRSTPLRRGTVRGTIDGLGTVKVTAT
jgi:2-keto-4-pentenoate hydratase